VAVCETVIVRPKSVFVQNPLQRVEALASRLRLSFSLTPPA
jgi:hypothetical protein